MAFTVPNIESSPTYDGQSVSDATDLAIVTATNASIGVVSGMAVTFSSVLTVAVASGVVNIGNTMVTYAGGTVAVGAGNTTDRRDIVVINSSGTLSVVAGTASPTANWTRTSTALPPVKPGIPANSIVLAEVYVPASASSISSGNIIDKRCTLLAPAATSTVIGGVQLAGDLAGTSSTAAAPKVGGINGVAISAALATLLTEAGSTQTLTTTATIAATSPTVLLGPTTASQTFTLPTTPTTGTSVILLNYGTAACTVSAGGTNTIGLNPGSYGVTTFTLNPGRWAYLSFAGSTWYGFWHSNQTLESYVAAGAPTALGSGSWTNLSNVTLTPGTWLITGRVTFTSTTASLLFADAILSTSSASVTNSIASASASMGNLAGAAEWQSVSMTRVLTVSVSTIVYLEAYASGLTISYAPSTHQSTAAIDATGITAVQIG